MKAFRYMIVANLKMSYRNRTALFWNLAFPLIFIVLFQFLFSGDDLSIDVGIVGEDTSPVSQEVVSEMRGAEGFNISTGSEESELDALDDGDRSVVVVFSPGTEGSELNARLYWDETDPQLGQVALGAVSQFLTEVNVGMMSGVPVIAIEEEAVESSGIEYMDYLIPGILAMSIMNTGMIGLASAFVTYRERGILRRVRATPFPLSSFIMARILSQLVVAVAQAVVLITAGVLIANLAINGNLLYVLVMVTLGSLAFLSLGFVVAAFARNQETADSLANAFTFPMLFLGGVFFPVDSAPDWLQPIMRLIPLRYLADGLRNLMIHDATLLDEWSNVLVMISTAIVGFGLALRFFRWESSNT
ncbi:MAG TPA: ABC transporter permease [Thermomicrobiales bacterium]|nr:ABC transporter permease [Thermomicrobiales bacterium]